MRGAIGWVRTSGKTQERSREREGKLMTRRRWMRAMGARCAVVVVGGERGHLRVAPCHRRGNGSMMTMRQADLRVRVHMRAGRMRGAVHEQRILCTMRHALV